MNYDDIDTSLEPFDRFVLAAETAEEYCEHMLIHEGDADDVVHDVRVRLARQARTIRRMCALADGYRARWRGVLRKLTMREAELVETAKWGHQHELHGAKLERVRIVAALRERADKVQCQGGHITAAATANLADAIERGEL